MWDSEPKQAQASVTACGKQRATTDTVCGKQRATTDTSCGKQHATTDTCSLTLASKQDSDLTLEI